jgi:hypothetical protein
MTELEKRLAKLRGEIDPRYLEDLDLDTPDTPLTDEVKVPTKAPETEDDVESFGAEVARKVGGGIVGFIAGLPILAGKAIGTAAALATLPADVRNNMLAKHAQDIKEWGQDYIEHPQKVLPLAGELVGGALGGGLGAAGGRLLGETALALFDKHANAADIASNVLLAPLGAAPVSGVIGKLAAEARAGASTGVRRAVGEFFKERMPTKNIETIIPATPLSDVAHLQAEKLIAVAKAAADRKREDAIAQAVEKFQGKPLSSLEEHGADAATVTGGFQDWVGSDDVGDALTKLSAMEERKKQIADRRELRKAIKENLKLRWEQQLEADPDLRAAAETERLRSKVARSLGVPYEPKVAPPQPIKLEPLAALEDLLTGTKPKQAIVESADDVARELDRLANPEDSIHAARKRLAYLEKEGKRLDTATKKLQEDPNFQFIADDLRDLKERALLMDTGFGHLLTSQDATGQAQKSRWWDKIITNTFGSDAAGWSQYLRGAGLMPAVWNPQRRLRQMGPVGEAMADLGNDAETLAHVGTTYFQRKAGEVFKKHGIQGQVDHEWWDLIHRAPRLMELYRENPDANIKDLVTMFTAETGKRLAVNGEKEFAALERNLRAAHELQTEVHDPLFAFARLLGTEPETFNHNYMLPTYTSARMVQELDTEINHLNKHLATISPSDPQWERVSTQVAALQRKKNVATKFADETEAGFRKALALYEQQGIIPRAVNNPAFRTKYTDVGFGMNMEDTLRDYISGFVRKSVYDVALPRMLDLTKQVDNPRVAQYMTNYALDQLGKRRLGQIEQLKSFLKDMGAKDSHVENALGFLDTVQGFNAMSNIALNGRFPILQQAQLLINVAPVLGPEAFSHAWATVTKDVRGAYDRAVQAGAVQPGLHQMWEDLGFTKTGQRLARSVDAINRIPAASEAFNRMIAYEGGLYRAKLAGLSDNAARKKALATVLFTNFGYTPAHRPTMSGTLAGSILGRYRSYGLQQANFLAKLWETDKQAFFNSVLTSLAFAGTGGVPLFSAIQWAAAKQGINLPNLNPFTEVTGIDLGGSADPFLQVPPATVEGLAGPIVGPILNTITGATQGDEPVLAKGLRGMAGAGVVKPAEALDELLRGGMTTTGSGAPIMQRDTKTIVKHAFNLAPSARQAIRQSQAEVSNAIASGRPEALLAAIAKGRKAGVLDMKSQISQARSRQTRANNRSFLDELLSR